MAQSSGEVRDASVDAGSASVDEVPLAPTSDEIRSQIEQTRAEMSDTLDAIQSRLSPSRVLTEAKDSVLEATVGRVKRLAPRNSVASVWQRAQDDPLPIALVATAAAGLLVRVLRNKTRARRYGTMPARSERHRLAWSANGTKSKMGRANRGLLAAAGAGVACWAIWRAQVTPARFRVPTRASDPRESGR